MSGRDDEDTEYVSARMMSLRRTAYLLCQDWHRADDLVQATITKLYVHWSRARAADHIDAYARTVLVREFLGERRSAWARRVSLDGRVAEARADATDHDAAHAHGLSVSIATYGSERPRAISIFRDHLRILGPDRSRWTAHPLG